LSEEYLGPQKTQRAAVFFYTADLGWESDLKSNSKQMKKYFKLQSNQRVVCVAAQQMFFKKTFD
jgi:hypothetical protein